MKVYTKPQIVSSGIMVMDSQNSFLPSPPVPLAAVYLAARALMKDDVWLSPRKISTLRRCIG